MNEEILDNLQAVEDDDDVSNFPQFQQKQIAEFIKKIMNDNIIAQKAFRDKFNRCLTLFVFYLSHMISLMKEENRKKKNEKKRVQVTKEDIIMTLKAIDFQEIAETLENIKILQTSQENVMQQENFQDQGLEDNEMREIQNFENLEDEQKDEENNDNQQQDQNVQEQVEQVDEDIEDENNQIVVNDDQQQ